MDRQTFLARHGLNAWRAMSCIREMEQRLPAYQKAGYFRGSAHPSVGMEAIAVGVSLQLRTSDVVAGTHRGHGHVLAKGAAMPRVLAEIFGRSLGYCKGKGGSMHVGVRDLGILGSNGIVGASIGLATGVALAAQHQGKGDVAVAYFGDGAINQGIFHEALNLASIWKLPAIYVCENNQYAQSSSVKEMVAVEDLSIRAASYAMPGYNIDGMDVYAVWTAANEAIERARRGEGPSLIVATTYRYLGHMVGDSEMYRTVDEKARWQASDGIARLARDLVQAALITADELAREQAAVVAGVDAAEKEALASPPAAREEAFTDVYGEIAR